MENLREFIKSRKRNRIYRYSIRRLSIGVVSCVVGAFVLFAPVNFGKAELSGVVYASEVEKYSDLLLEVQQKDDNDGKCSVVLVSKSFTQDNHDLKDVKLVIGDNKKEIKLEPDKSNPLIREGKIDATDLGKKFKVAIYDSSKKENPTYYAGGILREEETYDKLQKEEKQEGEREKERERERETLQKINVLKEKVQQLVEDAAKREEIVTKVAEEVTKEAEKIKEKLNKGEISGAATEAETVKNKVEEAANLAKEAKTYAEKAKQAAEELEKKAKEVSGEEQATVQKLARESEEALQKVEEAVQKAEEAVQKAEEALTKAIARERKEKEEKPQVDQSGEESEKKEPTENANFDKIRDKVKETLKEIKLSEGNSGMLMKVLKTNNYDDLLKLVFEIQSKEHDKGIKEKLIEAVVDVEGYLSDAEKANLKTNVEDWSKNEQVFKRAVDSLKNHVENKKKIEKKIDDLFEKAAKVLRNGDKDYGRSSVTELEKNLLKIKDLDNSKEFTQEKLKELEKTINPLIEKMGEEKDLKNKLRENIKSLKDEKEIGIFSARIDKAKNLEELKVYKSKIDAKGKEETFNEISKLEFLNEEEKKYYKTVLDNTEEFNHFKTVFDIAKEKNEAIEAKIKDNIKNDIDKLAFLNKEEKEFYKSQLGGATSPNSVSIVIELAEEKDKAKEIELKDAAKEYVDKLSDLTETSKKLAKKDIDEATNVETIKDIAERAKLMNKKKAEKALEELVKKELKEVKEAAKEYIDNLSDLTETSKKLAKKDIDEATNVETIKDIAERAKLMNKKKAEKALEELIKKEKEKEKPVEPKVPEEPKKPEEKPAEPKKPENEPKEKEEKPSDPKQPEKPNKPEPKDPEKNPEEPKKPEEKPAEPKQPENEPKEKEEKPKEVIPAMPLTPGIKVIPSTPLQPSIKVAPRAFRNDNDQRGSIDWRYIKAPSKDAKAEVQKQKTVIEVKIKIGSDILQRTINNHTQEIKMDTKAIIKDGRTMLPIRYVAEALGYTVEWREDTRTAILKDKETTIEIPVDTNKIIINGKEIQSDVKPMIENGRTMLPIANIARALGLKDGQDIKWDEAKQEVTIRKEIIN